MATLPVQLEPYLYSDGRVLPEHVERAVSQIVHRVHPLQVIAFGSRARGTHRPDSDLDLAVLVEHPLKHSELNRSHLLPDIAIDMLVSTRERHDFMKESIVSVHHHIAHEGVVLYDAAVGSIDCGAAARLAR